MVAEHSAIYTTPPRPPSHPALAELTDEQNERDDGTDEAPDQHRRDRLQDSEYTCGGQTLRSATRQGIHLNRPRVQQVTRLHQKKRRELLIKLVKNLKKYPETLIYIWLLI